MQLKKSLPLLLILVLSPVFGSAADTIKAPRLKAKLQRNTEDARISWQFDRKYASRGTSADIEIERTDAGGAQFKAFKLLRDVKNRSALMDSDLGPGVYQYRARILTDGGNSAWSSTAKLTVAGGVTPPPGGGNGDPTDPPLISGQEECPAGYAAEVLRLVNEARANANPPAAPLRANDELNKAARAHTIYRVWYAMETTDPEAGTAQDPGHAGWVDFIRDAGYNGGHIGENISWGDNSAQKAVSGWMGSSGHRQNILRPTFRDHGIGCVVFLLHRNRGGTARILFWTQDFGGGE